MADLAHLSLAGAARRIAARELSALELAEATFARIAAFDERLGSHVTLMTESALAAARAADAEIAAGRRRGPLHGVTVALKDIYDTEGVLTAGGSRTGLGRIPDRDAETVRRLRAAGAVITGKLTTHEYAHGGPSFDLPWPPARNPWNVEHFSGGSSSGSGVAVAAGLCLGALGTDTGGSIRGPAALSGVTGLMPSYGLVSRRGVIPNSFTFDHCGPLAWTAEDCGLLLDALAGFDPEDPRSSPEPPRAAPASMAGLRIGLLRHFWEEDLSVSPELVAACEHVADVLRGLGAEVETARIAPVQDWYDVKITIAESELFNVHRRNLQSRPRDFGHDFLSRALGAVCFTAQDYVAAHRRWRQLLRSMKPVHERFDLLIAPSATGPAPRLDAHRTVSFWRSPSITTPFDVTGGPALTLTAGFSANGLPLGVQLAAAPFHDRLVLAAGQAFQAETEWGRRRPVLEAGDGAALEAYPLPAPELPRDRAIQDEARTLAALAGLPEDDEFLLALIAEAAPHARAMAARLDRDYAFSDEI
ncbi:MAG: amidase [Immundisolibacterales bacterium]|nr:amidase [Immundisolibacterales bacterium]